MHTVRAALASILLISACAWCQSDIHLKSGLGRPALPGARRGDHYILHFRTYPTADLRDELTSRGIRVLQYIPDNALMVSSGASADLSGLPLLGTASLNSSDKISPLLAQQVAGSLLAIFHSDVDPLRAQQIVRSIGFDIV